MLILGIETSCDDTSAAIVRDGKEILSNIVSSQDEFHKAFSGVVPEIASRRHLESINHVVKYAFEEAGLEMGGVDSIAVTTRPGLIGSLIVGLSAAKAYAYSWNKPIIPINHISAHLYSAAFGGDLDYPLIGLVISGGHTLLIKASSPTDLEFLGTTIDDAVGEAYDKIAKHFGLGYPGGPVIDRLASRGDSGAYDFPRSLLNQDKHRYNFSFSGIKTAVIHQRDRFKKDSSKSEDVKDIAASFQNTVSEILLEKVKRAVRDTGIKRVAVAGGVAANSSINRVFTQQDEFKAVFPPKKLCTDNAAMVAGLAFHVKEKYSYKEAMLFDAKSRIIKKGYKK